MRSPLVFYAGVGIVLITHISMLTQKMPDSQKQNHAYINLTGAAMILYGA